MSKFPPDPFHDIDDDEPTFAPIILVREAEEAAAVLCDVVTRFLEALHLVEPISTRPPRDRFDEVVYLYVTPDLFALLNEMDRIVAYSRSEDYEIGFPRLTLTQILGGDQQKFGITIGDEMLEAALRKSDYDVRTFVLPEETSSPERNADHLATFVFGLLDPDDDGCDNDDAFHPTPEDLPPEDGSDAMSLDEYFRERIQGR